MTIIESIKQRNDVLFYFGLITLLGAITTFVLIQVTTTRVNGINTYYKPMKFFISVFLFTWTFAFYMQYLDNQPAVKVFSWVAVIGLGYELFAITLQASRGKLSHYNTETTFDATIVFLMIIAILVITLAMVYIGFLFFIQSKFNTNIVFIWSIRLSIILTIIFACEGFIMGSLSKHTIGAADGTAGLPITNWSKKHGDLRIAHFFGIHAIQVVPLISVYLAKNIFHVFIIALVYLLIITYTFVQALFGKPLI